MPALPPYLKYLGEAAAPLGDARLRGLAPGQHIPESETSQIFKNLQQDSRIIDFSVSPFPIAVHRLEPVFFKTPNLRCCGCACGATVFWYLRKRSRRKDFRFQSSACACGATFKTCSATSAYSVNNGTRSKLKRTSKYFWPYSPLWYL